MTFSAQEEGQKGEGGMECISFSLVFSTTWRAFVTFRCPSPPNSLECQPDRLTPWTAAAPVRARANNSDFANAVSLLEADIKVWNTRECTLYHNRRGMSVLELQKKSREMKKSSVNGSMFHHLLILRTCFKLLALLCCETEKMQLVFRRSLRVELENLLFPKITSIGGGVRTGLMVPRHAKDSQLWGRYLAVLPSSNTIERGGKTPAKLSSPCNEKTRQF